MESVLADAELYTFTGGEAPTRNQLAARYAAQISGPSNPDETWHNWIIRLIESDVAVGFVQATIVGAQSDVAWVVGLAAQRRGIAREAAQCMCDWLRSTGISRLTAHIHPDHVASARVGAACQLVPTGNLDDYGEMVWAWP
jgi:RimJ/RimL family protein N-acetyltransferase